MPKDTVQNVQGPRQPGLHKTACRMCRQRKIKCNKLEPCNNCVQTDQVCEFPPAIRTVRRPKKAGNESISSLSDARSVMDRLESLETMLMRSFANTQTPICFAEEGDRNVLQRSPHTELGAMGVAEEAWGVGTPKQKPWPSSKLAEHDPEMGHSGCPRQRLSPFGDSVTPPTENSDDTLYWLSLENETNQGGVPHGLTQGLTSYPTGESATSQWSTTGVNEQLSTSRLPFEPVVMTPPLLALNYRHAFWKAFVRNVDPIIKILHKPTAEKMILVPDNDHYQHQPSSGAMVHATCLLAAISMTPDEFYTTFGENQEFSINSLTRTAEEALLAAKFLEVPDLVTLQAFVLFLYALKNNEDPRWITLSGAAIRSAERMKLNIDGASLGLTPFQVELRRRLWWQLLVIVDRTDDCGPSPLVLSVYSEVELPLNINDHELDPHAQEISHDHRGFTEASFCLMQYSIIRAFHRINFERLHRKCQNLSASLEEADRQLQILWHDITARYLQNGSAASQPLQHFISGVIAMMIMKRQLLVWVSNYQNISNTGSTYSQKQRDRLFLIGIQVLEISRKLQTDSQVRDWSWLLGTYFQWCVMSLVIKELAVRPKSYITNRAWKVIDGMLDAWPTVIRTSPKALAINALMTNAVFRKEGYMSMECRFPKPSGMAMPDNGLTTRGRGEAEEQYAQAQDDESMTTRYMLQGTSSRFGGADMSDLDTPTVDLDFIS